MVSSENADNVDLCKNSPCGPNSSCINFGEFASCYCLDGFIGNPPNCQQPECFYDSQCPQDKACFRFKCTDVCMAQNCHKYSKCVVKDHEPVCECQAGYIKNENRKKCEENPDLLDGYLSTDESFKHHEKIKNFWGKYSKENFTIFFVNNETKINKENFEVSPQYKNENVKGFVIMNFACDRFCDENSNVKFLPIRVEEIFPNSVAYLVNNFEITEVKKRNLENLTKLEFLALVSNEIGKIEEDSFDDLHELQFLILTRNYIKSINKRWFEITKKIQVINFSWNEIEAIENPKIFDGLTNLKEIYLERNIIKTLNPRIFINLNNLKALELEGNRLQYFDDEILENLTELEKFSLGSENELNILPDKLFQKVKNLKNFKKLRLFGACDIKENSEVFIDSKQLEELGLSGCPIEKLPERIFINLNNLKIFDLSKMDLKKISLADIEHMVQLENLDLSHNQLTSLEDGIFDNFVNLKKLFLNSNSITSLNGGIFDKLTNLEEINLSSNKIKDLNPKAFRGLTNLKLLDLSINQIKTLSANIFKDLKSLEMISLSENKLQTLADEIFDNSPNLDYINLRENNITSLSFRIFENKLKLEMVDLYDNECTNHIYDRETNKEMKNKLKTDIERVCYKI